MIKMRNAEFGMRNAKRNYLVHLNPEGRNTREKPFCPQIAQMDADFKKHNSGLI